MSRGPCEPIEQQDVEEMNRWLSKCVEQLIGVRHELQEIRALILGRLEADANRRYEKQR